MPYTGPMTTISNNDSYIRKESSGVLWGMEMKSTGSPLDTDPDAYHRFGRVQKSVFELKKTQTKEKDQGNVEIITGNETSCTFSYTIMQRDKAHIVLPTAMDGKYLQFVQELTNRTLNGKMQYLIIPVALIEPTVTVDGSDMYVKHSFTCSAYAGASALTVTLTGLVGSLGTVGTLTATIAVGDYYGIVEATA